MVKDREFEAEKDLKCQFYKLFNFAFMSYGHFPARNGSKSTIDTQKLEKVNRWLHWFLVDFF